MSNDVPIKYYDIVDEYTTEAATPVSEAAQTEMAVEAGIDTKRIDDIANFLNQWGNE